MMHQQARRCWPLEVDPHTEREVSCSPFVLARVWPLITLGATFRLGSTGTRAASVAIARCALGGRRLRLLSLLRARTRRGKAITRQLEGGP